MPTVRVRPKELLPLRPVQAEGLAFNLPVTHPAWVCEMRLGKTRAAIRWAILKNLTGPILVIAPLTTLEAWEYQLFEEGEPYSTLHGMLPSDRFNALEWAWNLGRRHWILLTYGTLLAEGEVHTRVSKSKKVWRKDPETGEKVEVPKETRIREVPDIAYLPWDAVLLDESTEIRNPSAQISKVCMKGFRFAKHRSILTGLINPESDFDVFAQFVYLHGEFMGETNFWEWRTKHFYKLGFQWIHKPGMKAAIKAEVHRLAFVKTVRGAGLPCSVEFRTRRVDMTTAQRKLYMQVLHDYAITLESGEEVETQWKLTQRSWLLGLAGGFTPEGKLVSAALADETIKLLKGELSGRKVVIWFSRRPELAYLAQRLEKAKISFEFITGDDGSREVRKRKLAAFRGPKIRVLLCMELCAQYGVDCSAADTAIYYSNEPGNEARQQSLKRIQMYIEGRVHLIIDLVTRGTISEEVVKLVKRKGISSRLFMVNIDNALLRAARSLRIVKPVRMIPVKRI